MSTTPTHTQSNDDLEVRDFIKDLVISKTGIDYEKLSEEDQNKIGLEIFNDYVKFIDQALNAVGDEQELKHWNMYKTSGLNPKLLETLSTLQKSIEVLTEEYIKI